MGPRALKVRSMCLWSCRKRSSLQNFTKLTQPLLPVWGISSNLLTRPSTPFFPTPALSALFLPSNFPCATVPAAATQRPLNGATPQSRFLDPEVARALTHTVTWMYMLLMVQTGRVSSRVVTRLVVSEGPITSLLHPQPRVLQCVLSLWWTDSGRWFMDVKIRVQENKNRAQMSSWSRTHKHTHSHIKAIKSESS